MSDPPEGEPADAGARQRLSVVASSRKSRPSPPVSNDTRVASMEEVEQDESDGDGPDDAEATHAGPPISVEVLEGPDAGKRKRVRGGRMVIGRGDGCDLKLRDTSASRRHLELIVGFSGAIVRDLGSGNGTKVNGERVDEAAVGHGDEILLGTTLLKIVDDIALMEERRRPKEPEPTEQPAAAEGVEPPPQVEPASGVSQVPGTAAIALPHDEGRKKPNPLLFVAIGAGALVLLLVLVLALKSKPNPVAPPSHDNEVAALVQQAKTAILAEDYDRALSLCDKISALDANDPDQPELRKHAEKQKEGKQKLAAAEGLLAEHQFGPAREALKSIDELANAHDRAVELLKTLDAQEAAFVASQADQKIGAEDLDGARALVPRLQELSSAQADRVTKAIAVKQGELEARELRNVKNKKKRAQLLKEMARRKQQEAVRGALESGFRKFHEAATPGQYERAANEFDRLGESAPNTEARVRARELARKVRDFAKALGEADELDADQAYEAEVAPADRALALVQQIDASSAAVARLRNRVLRGLILKGHNAAARQDYAVAAKAFKRALELKPGDSDARSGLAQLKGRAHDVYLQAYEEQARDPETARKLYQAVMQMLGPADDDYQKAQKRLAELNNP